MTSIDIAAFRMREAQGLINCISHPTDDLLLWNYTTKCQFAQAWDEVTVQARGLITRSDGTIVALAFPKFFNLSERPETHFRL
jgi:RNA ligase